MSNNALSKEKNLVDKIKSNTVEKTKKLGLAIYEKISNVKYIALALFIDLIVLTIVHTINYFVVWNNAYLLAYGFELYQIATAFILIMGTGAVTAYIGDVSASTLKKGVSLAFWFFFLVGAGISVALCVYTFIHIVITGFSCIGIFATSYTLVIPTFWWFSDGTAICESTVWVRTLVAIILGFVYFVSLIVAIALSIWLKVVDSQLVKTFSKKLYSQALCSKPNDYNTLQDIYVLGHIHGLTPSEIHTSDDHHLIEHGHVTEEEKNENMEEKNEFKQTKILNFEKNLEEGKGGNNDYESESSE